MLHWIHLLDDKLCKCLVTSLATYYKHVYTAEYDTAVVLRMVVAFR